jgi:hypothetical protein
MTPRLIGLRADDVLASHIAADGAVLAIQAARTYASGTSARAAAVLRVLSASLETKKSASPTNAFFCSRTHSPGGVAWCLYSKSSIIAPNNAVLFLSMA